MPAKSMYSYADTLYALLDAFKPERVFEWGPGTSTQIMALHPSVKSVVSVEHEIQFYDMIEKLNFGNVIFKYENGMEEYVKAPGDERYDLVFVDGRDRSRCLDMASKITDLVVLHDAARSDYREAVENFKFQVWTDQGNTAVLTNDEAVYVKVKNCLSALICRTPKVEKVMIVGHSRERGDKL
jgi:predicted O-methyltransferase YrrM